MPAKCLQCDDAVNLVMLKLALAQRHISSSDTSFIGGSVDPRQHSYCYAPYQIHVSPLSLDRRPPQTNRVRRFTTFDKGPLRTFEPHPRALPVTPSMLSLI